MYATTMTAGGRSVIVRAFSDMWKEYMKRRDKMLPEDADIEVMDLQTLLCTKDINLQSLNGSTTCLLPQLLQNHNSNWRYGSHMFTSSMTTERNEKVLEWNCERQWYRRSIILVDYCVIHKRSYNKTSYQFQLHVYSWKMMVSSFSKKENYCSGLPRRRDVILDYPFDLFA